MNFQQFAAATAILFAMFVGLVLAIKFTTDDINTRVDHIIRLLEKRE